MTLNEKIVMYTPTGFDIVFAIRLLQQHSHEEYEMIQKWGLEKSENFSVLFQSAFPEYQQWHTPGFV